MNRGKEWLDRFLKAAGDYRSKSRKWDFSPEQRAMLREADDRLCEALVENCDPECLMLICEIMGGHIPAGHPDNHILFAVRGGYSRVIEKQRSNAVTSLPEKPASQLENKGWTGSPWLGRKLTDTPIDLTAERQRREQPDRQFVTADEYGRPLYTFTAMYKRADGGRYAFHFLAYDQADAEDAIAGMNAGVEYGGQVFSEVPG